MKLSDLIGDSILLMVEAGGIWVESQELTNAVLQTLGVAAAPKTLVMFFPYHEIYVITTAIDGPSLDEKAFGV
jgi:hypothetical protein